MGEKPKRKKRERKYPCDFKENIYIMTGRAKYYYYYYQHGILLLSTSLVVFRRAHEWDVQKHTLKAGLGPDLDFLGGGDD